jgi:hypothetical protein
MLGYGRFFGGCICATLALICVAAVLSRGSGASVASVAQVSNAQSQSSQVASSSTEALAIAKSATKDDIAELVAVCGETRDVETTAPKDNDDGKWHRVLQYRSGDAPDDWMVVGFTAQSRKGPWKYQTAMFKKLPCLTSAGLSQPGQ